MRKVPLSMASTALATCLVLVLTCFVTYGSCANENLTETNGTIDWKDKFEENNNEGSTLQTEYDAKGLQPWYDFANSFISTVLNKDPYELVFKAKQQKLTDNIKDDIILGYALGMVIVVGIGLLFCLLMPIVGLCFCCCRLCGKCGGEMSQKDSPNNNCKRAVFGVILLIITLLMFTGVLLTFVCNDRMSDTVDGMVDTSSGILNEAISFINRTVGEAEKLLVVDFPFVVNLLRQDITDASLKKLVGDPLLREIDKVSVEPIEAVKDLSEQTKLMRDQLEVIKSNSNNLSSLAGDLEIGLNDAKANLTEIKNNCSLLRGSLVFCDDINPDDLAAEANFTNLPNVTDQLSNVQDVVNQDFEKTAEEGLKEAKDIPNKIINDTRETRGEISTMISNASDTVMKMNDDLHKQAKDVISKLETLRDTDIPNLQKEHIKEYNYYRWSVGVGLTCISLLIVVLMALGLMCGICGHDKEATPTTRGTVSNMGGISLMAAVGFCFIFASFLMLLTTICFIIGAPMQTICKAIQSGELYNEVIDKPEFWGADGNLLSKNIFGEKDKDIAFSIGGFLKNCRENKPLFVAGPFNEAFNVSKRLDINELLGNDTTKQFDDLKVNLSDVNILSNETRQSLIDLSNSGVDQIDFDAFLNETKKGITAVNLQAFAQNVSDLATKFQTAAANLSGADQDTAYELGNKSEQTAQALRDLDTNTVKVMEALSNDLDENVKDLESIGSDLKVAVIATCPKSKMADVQPKNRANDTLAAAEEAENYLHTNTSAKISEIVEDYTGRVLGWGHKFTDHVWDLLTTKLARCKPVTNIYDASIVVVCNQFLYPFNGFWFSIGYCLFFFIPAIIFCVKLAKHYRRMDYESDFDQGIDPEMYEMGHHASAPPAYDTDKKHWANPNGYQNYR